MSNTVIAAVVAGVVSLVVTFGKIAWDARQARREQRLASRERLDRYRAPLLAAVDDLGRRVNNIRNDGFLAYLDLDHRRDMAQLSTLFRLAQYLGWVEVVYGYSDRLRFESDRATKAVTDTLGDIGWILAADEFDRTDEDDFTTSRLALWREEQRAIGELMRLPGDEPRCMSFNSFVDTYDERFTTWLATFAEQLHGGSTPTTNRLAELHRVLARLVQQLDVDRVILEVDDAGRVTKPIWAQPANLTRPTRHTDRGKDPADVHDSPAPGSGRTLPRVQQESTAAGPTKPDPDPSSEHASPR